MVNNKKEIQNKNEEKDSNLENEKNSKEKVKSNNEETSKEKEEIVINEEKLEKIGEEIKKQNTISEKKQGKIYKKILKNIVIACLIVIYFIFLNLGYTNLEPGKYLIDLQTFSMITIGLTIIIFEKSYKKDSGELALFGIESLALSICTLMTISIGIKYKEKYTYIINTISMLFAIYYVAKSIVIYCKMKNKALNRTRDIQKIGRIKE